MKLNILDLCPYWCWPTTGGGPVRVYNLNNAVSEFVNIFQFSVRPTLGHRNKNLSSWIGSRMYNHTPGYLEFQYFNIFILGACYLLYRYSLHSDIFLSSLLSITPTRRLLKGFLEADIIQVEHPWLFKYAWHHAKGKPIIYVAHNIETELWRGKENSVIGSRLERMEYDALLSSDAVVCVSEEDYMVLQERYHLDSARVTIIPNGIAPQLKIGISSTEKQKAKSRLGLEGKYVILFTGSDHYPNKEAMQLIRSWQPAFEKQEDIQFLVIGTVGSGVASSSYMRVEGFVDKIQDYFLAADLAVNLSGQRKWNEFEVG